MGKTAYPKAVASVIIPAWNEARTIAEVVFAAKRHPSVREVIVVDDGSTDRTASEARRAGGEVIRFDANRGKGSAMEEGVRRAKGDIILFLDADLRGLTDAAITVLLDPVLSGTHDMFLGIHDRGGASINTLFRWLPKSTGQRALTRAVWEAVPPRYLRGFGIETALNYFARKNGRRVGTTLLSGVRQVVKERKRGFHEGFMERCIMIRDVCATAYQLYLIDSLGAFMFPRAASREGERL